jgi:hypothetical protein
MRVDLLQSEFISNLKLDFLNEIIKSANRVNGQLLAWANKKAALL